MRASRNFVRESVRKVNIQTEKYTHPIPSDRHIFYERPVGDPWLTLAWQTEGPSACYCHDRINLCNTHTSVSVTWWRLHPRKCKLFEMAWIKRSHEWYLIESSRGTLTINFIIIIHFKLFCGAVKRLLLLQIKWIFNPLKMNASQKTRKKETLKQKKKKNSVEKDASARLHFYLLSWKWNFWCLRTMYYKPLSTTWRVYNKCFYRKSNKAPSL